jgi:uncharacterized membrane protein
MTDERLRRDAATWVLFVAIAIALIIVCTWAAMLLLQRPIPAELWGVVSTVVGGLSVASALKLVDRGAAP